MENGKVEISNHQFSGANSYFQGEIIFNVDL